ncbi:MAG: hypothetical protein JWM41_2906 [Gemmatimonadetes bacterium]|nr:hypothetical protein [Gemmatimonadota bacterium]
MGKSNPGPNDFHFAPTGENGTLTLMPGLGADEPDDLTKEQMQADAQANRDREAALDRAAEAIRDEAASLERKQEEMDRREDELKRREARIRELEAAANANTASNEPSAKRRASATERPE